MAGLRGTACTGRSALGGWVGSQVSLAGLLGPPTGRCDPLGGTPMAGAGKIAIEFPPVRDSLDQEQGRAPSDENEEGREVSYQGREHGKPPLAGWLVEFAGRFSLRARMIAWNVIILWSVR